MANNLTGDYEAVLEVSVRQINGILATFHQNGGEKDKSPHFPHSIANYAVGAPPKILDPGIVRFSQWLSDVVKSVRASGGPGVSYLSPLEIGAHLAEKAPPGAIEPFNKHLRDLITARDEVVPPDTVSGLADLQISTPAINLVRSQVVVHVYIRARYYPAGGTPALPAPIHGEVRIMYDVLPKSVNGKNSLVIVIPADDSRIQFFPAPNSVSQSQADNKIVRHIRKAIRERFKADPVDLGTNFKLFEFKSLGSFGNLLDHEWVDALGTGADQALVLPMQLSGNPAPPGAIDSVTNLFLGTGPSQNDFAIAVSQEYVKTKFAPTLDKLRQFTRTFEVELPWYITWPNPTYHLSVTGVDLQFKFGWIDLIIHAKATTRALGFSNYDPIVITQRLKLGVGLFLFLFPSPTVYTVGLLTPDDSDLTITGITGLGSEEANSRARTEIIAERDKALPAAEAAIGQAFQDALQQLNDALLKFDDSASARYTAIEVNPDGIIVRGDVDTLYHLEPQVDIDYTSDGKFWTALNSWIPGGRIDSFTWQWVKQAVYKTRLANLYFTIPWEGQVISETVRHRFTHSIPAELLDRPIGSKNVCLTIEGTQVAADGNVIGVSAGLKSGSCTVTAREPFVVLDPVTDAINEILGWPDPPGPVEILEENLLGHINVLAAHPLPPGGVTSNTLIYFAGPRADKPMAALDKALGQIRRRDFALTFVIVMPRGALASGRREVEERLGLVEEGGQWAASGRTNEDRPELQGEGLPVRLVITEDYVEGWSRAFGVKEAPASYLVNARGEFVWKQEGSLDPERLAAALDKHLLPSLQRPALPLRLTVQPGERALDATFEDDQGQVLALRRLRGRQVLLNFWQSWSVPCIKELRRLQLLHEAGGERAAVIVAVNGGEAHEAIAEVRRQHKLTFALVPDADQRFARLYGVACWPTTVAINEEGIVNRVQFGQSHEHREETANAAS
jgi:peroxiredoxin